MIRSTHVARKDHPGIKAGERYVKFVTFDPFKVERVPEWALRDEDDGTCPHCGGSGGGTDKALRCPHCRGKGYREVNRNCDDY